MLETKIQWAHNPRQGVANTIVCSGVRKFADKPRDVGQTDGRHICDRRERLSRLAEGERAFNMGELDEAKPTQTNDQGDPNETSSATTVAKRATSIVTAGQRKQGQPESNARSKKNGIFRRPMQ
ncbi:hypothetical protein AMTRI_Chr13g91180 [Amborella trichopoda]